MPVDAVGVLKEELYRAECGVKENGYEEDREEVSFQGLSAGDSGGPAFIA